MDTGHHSLGVNIEQIVALLLAEGRLGAFDLNDKKYGDDDLMVGSIDPYQLFRIAHELVNAMRDDGDPDAQRCARETVYMLDQCHNIEPKVPAMIRSVMNLQETFAKALLVDREALLAAQAARRRPGGQRLLWAAFTTDVRGRARRAARGARAAGRSLSTPTSTAARRRRARPRASEARPPAGRAHGAAAAAASPGPGHSLTPASGGLLPCAACS